MLTDSRAQIKLFVEGLFTLNHQYDRFKLNLRDFLIQLKEFAGDNTELFAEEKEQLDRENKAAERERLSKVGGLLKPAELAEDDDELWLEEELRSEYAEATAKTDDHKSHYSHADNIIIKQLNGWDMYGLRIPIAAIPSSASLIGSLNSEFFLPLDQFFSLILYHTQGRSWEELVAGPRMTCLS